MIPSIPNSVGQVVNLRRIANLPATLFARGHVAHLRRGQASDLRRGRWPTCAAAQNRCTKPSKRQNTALAQTWAYETDEWSGSDLWRAPRHGPALGSALKELSVIATQNDPVSITGPITGPRWPCRQDRILTPQAVKFLVKLSTMFEPRRRRLLEARLARQERIDQGELPEFPKETAEIRRGRWKVAETPADLLDRRVEITGPTDRKMIINALNSGANVFMADFEDSNAPTWRNIVEGQVNLRDAVRGTIAYVNPSTGKSYRLNEKTATLVVRPRGWHLVENHVSIDGSPVS